MKASPLLIVLGATASGKTALAVELAAHFQAEIISADSRQVFKGMDIGTGKDLQDYRRMDIPYHLIDIREAGETYQVHAFKEDFYRAYAQIRERGKRAILCGGTGMYIHSLLQKHDFTGVPVNALLRKEHEMASKEELRTILKHYPDEFTAHADPSSHKRLIRAIEVAEYLQRQPLNLTPYPEIQPLVVGLMDERAVRRAKIEHRLENRLREGLIEEVRGLLDTGVSPDQLIYYGLEYKLATQYLLGILSYDQLKTDLFTAICQFSKRQMTFFRKMEKDGIDIHWLNASAGATSLKKAAIEIIGDFYEDN